MGHDEHDERVQILFSVIVCVRVGFNFVGDYRHCNSANPLADDQHKACKHAPTHKHTHTHISAIHPSDRPTAPTSTHTNEPRKKIAFDLFCIIDYHIKVNFVKCLRVGARVCARVTLHSLCVCRIRVEFYIVERAARLGKCRE